MEIIRVSPKFQKALFILKSKEWQNSILTLFKIMKGKKHTKLKASFLWLTCQILESSCVYSRSFLDWQRHFSLSFLAFILLIRFCYSLKLPRLDVFSRTAKAHELFFFFFSRALNYFNFATRLFYSCESPEGTIIFTPLVLVIFALLFTQKYSF